MRNASWLMVIAAPALALASAAACSGPSPTPAILPSHEVPTPAPAAPPIAQPVVAPSMATTDAGVARTSSDCLRTNGSAAVPFGLSVDASAFHVCLRAADAPPEGTPAAAATCFAIDRARGTYTSEPQSPTPKPPGNAVVTTTPTTVKVCKGTSCTTIKPGKDAHGNNQPLIADVDASDGAYVVVTRSPDANATYDVYSVATKQRTAHLPAAASGSSYTCGYGRMLGDVVMVAANVCAGPGGASSLYDVHGKKLGRLGADDTTNAYGATVVHLDGARYAFALPYAATLLVTDIKSGKQLQQIDLAKLHGSIDDGEPALAVEKLDDHTLVIATSAGSVGIVDLTAGGGAGALTTAWTATGCPAMP